MRDGFEAFVAGQATPLLRTAYLLTGDHAQARDLLQTALVATHRQWDALGDPTAYTRQQLVRAATGWQRRLRVGDLLTDSPLLAGTGGLPGFGAQTPAEPGPRTGLTAALARLAPRERAAVVLRHGEGEPLAATAAALGASLDETRGLLERGLAALADHLPDEGDGLVQRLRVELPVRAGDVRAAPADVLGTALDGARSRRRHLAGLAALAAFLVLVAVLVALTVR